MKNIFEKINTILLIVLVIFVGFSLYSNYSGYANASVVLDSIKSDYIYEIPSEEKLKEGQIKGLVESLGDPYAEYISKDKVNEFNDGLNQRYEGIGVSFNFENKTTVNKVFEDSPASKAGVLKDDVLTKIEGNPVDNLSQTEIISKIKGAEGTIVKLTFIRKTNQIEEEKNFEITRGKVKIVLVTSKIQQNQAMITIKSFGDDITSLFNTEALKIKADKNVDTIILNMLDNPGGRLDKAVDIISSFVNKEGVVVINEKTKSNNVQIKSNKNDVDLSNYKVKILVNSNSASASEIVTISLKELKNAKVYGQKTYGKGVVQKVVNLTNGDLLKYTIAEWLSPNNNSINKIGVTPDVVFEKNANFEEKIFTVD